MLTVQKARRGYGVVINSDSVDEKETRKLREKMRERLDLA
jgi:hypothetical protein